MDPSRAVERRASGARRPAAGRWRAALQAGLYRQLAADDDRVAYWVRHARIGVLLSEIGAWAVIGYALLTHAPGRDSSLLLALAGLVALVTPAVLLLPLAAMMRDVRGPLLFYGWSIAVTLTVGIASRIDGGGSSPLFALLFLTLGYMAVAYPPYGVVAMGALMTGTYVFFVALPDVTLPGLFIGVVMAAFTTTCALASANAWGAYDQQVLLIRTQETLAATDPLTGCGNRRAFLQRLEEAVGRGAGAPPTVVCLVDLDGFKGVNDRDGHAAGDLVLRAVVAALSAAVRSTDTVARLGGDEFAVLAQVDASTSAEELAERLRDAVAGVGAGCGVTASVGVADVRPGDDVMDLLYRADSAMYRAKSAGGNRVTALA